MQNNLHSLKKYKRVNAILIGIILSVIAQFFLETPYYPLIRDILYIFISIGVILQVPYLALPKNRFINLFIIFIFLSFLNSAIIYIIVGEFKTESITQVLLSLILLFLGYNMKIPKKKINQLILIYIILTTLLGLFIIFYYGSGFNILQQYFFSAKNQVGPFISSAAMICIITLLTKKNDDTLLSNKAFLIIVFTINFSVILSLRNRSGIVAIIVCLIIYFISKIKLNLRYKIKKQNIILFPMLLLLIFGIAFSNILNPIWQYIYDSLFLNYDVNDLNSLSANRTDIYIKIYEYIKISPFFGELTISSGITQIPHNYILYILFQFGIFGMIPLLLLYFYICLFIINQIFLKKETDISLFLMAFMLTISLFEYTYPFSPLTTVSLTWFMFGHYLNYMQEQKKGGYNGTL